MKTALTSIKFWFALLASLVFGLGVSAKAAGMPELTIVSPTLNQQASGNKVTLKLSSANFSLIDYATHARKTTGQGHIHLWLDQDNPTKLSAVKIFSDTYVFENIKPGKHVVLAELVNNDHTSLSPKVMSSVSFETGVTTNTSTQLSMPFLVACSAFLFLVIVLYFVNLQTKSESGYGKQHQKSSSIASKRSHRK